MLMIVFLAVCAARREEDGYQSVRKWTNKVDIFKKRFIIVPINEKFVLVV